jgi:hypothetical protein
VIAEFINDVESLNRKVELMPILCMRSETKPENGTKRANLVEINHQEGNRGRTDSIGDVESIPEVECGQFRACAVKIDLKMQ